MDEATINSLTSRAYQVGEKLLGALVLWIVGRWIIGFAMKLVGAGMTRQKIDATIIRYVQNTVSVLLNIVLVVAILEVFGVQTTTFAAMLAGAGLAIGAAWGGLLSNFAAGAFLVVLKPFKVGDFISAGGMTGTVEEVGLFVTTINTPDNIRTFVGNNKIFSDTVQNFTANPYRRVELTAQLANTEDPEKAIAKLGEGIRKIPNVLTNPAPDLKILSYTPFGSTLTVRPYCHNDNYWQVYFDSQHVIRQTLGTAGYPPPEVKPEING